MKKQIFGILIISILLFASCKIEPIFYAIEKEVPLEEAVIKGNLYAMTKFGENLYAASGKLYVKKTSVIRGWEEAVAPNGHIIRVASDSTNLYVLTSDKKLYTSTNGKNWTPINFSDIVELFDNKANGSNKEAFITSSNELLVLNGTTNPTLNPSGASKKYLAAVYDESETVFSDTILIAVGSKGIYTMNDENIVFKGTKSSIKVEDAESMAVYHDGTQEHLLVGTKNGIKRVVLENNGSPTKIGTALGDNVESSLALLSVPVLYSFGEAVYAGAVDPTTNKKTNVWAYYKNRSDWNLE